MRIDTLLLPTLALVSLVLLLHEHVLRNSAPRYSYVGDDFPPLVPIPPLARVEMTLEESMRFGLNSSDAIEAWGRNVPPGLGYLRLGPKRRIFAVAMYHQLHCLYQIKFAISNHLGGSAHLHHCLDYIRQNILCAADTTLEAKDFTQQNFLVDRVGGTRICKDWSVVHDFTVENYQDWLGYKAANMMDTESLRPVRESTIAVWDKIRNNFCGNK